MNFTNSSCRIHGNWKIFTKNMCLYYEYIRMERVNGFVILRNKCLHLLCFARSMNVDPNQPLQANICVTKVWQI